MDVVVIYGAPGVGKLTVATELASLTGFKLLDNHVTIDWARCYFDFNTPPFWKLDERLKLAVIDECVAVGVSLILTLVRTDAAHAERLDAQVAATGGRCHYVQLTCDRDLLAARLVSEERAAAGKLTNVTVLQRMLERDDLLAPAAGRHDLVIDNSNLAPDAAAQRIASHFGLGR
jgi:hypothetical protein